MTTAMRLTWVGVLALGGCVTPKTVGQTSESESGSESESESASESASEDGSEGTEESGDPGPGGQCPDNPGTCADVDGNFCGADAGGPISEFDADCCLRPRCDFDGECDGDRVCVPLGLWGSGASSSLSCTIEDDACVCGGTADGAQDPRVCVRPEDAPTEPPPQCITDATGDAYSLDPVDATGTATCILTGVTGVMTLELDCTGEIEGALSISIASEATTIRLDIGEEVTLDIDSRPTAEYVEQWLQITDSDGETVVFAARASSLVAPGDAPPWPLEIADLGCPGVDCGGGSSQGMGMFIRAGEGETIAVAPGESAELPGQFVGAAPVLDVFEARANCELIDNPSDWYAYAIVVP